MSAIDQEIISVTRTAYGVYLQTTKTLGLPFTLIPNTTLNERLNIQAKVKPNANEVPNMRYLAIGNLGHATQKADDGSDETIPVPHRSNDAGLYGQIPFVLRELSNDLPANRRAQYALRRIESHNGVQYFAYYLRRLNLDGVLPMLQQIEVVDGVETVTQYVPTTDDLNPKRPEISNSGIVLGSDRSISASAIIKANLTAEDVAEILAAHKIRTGSARSPVLSELALCSGVDRTVPGQSGTGANFSYLEAIAVQVNVFIGTNHSLGYASNGAEFTFDVGGVEPTLGEDDANAAVWLS
jgi:hypothetical protein